ncbi:MAG TPA: prolipoprotein diacylglyceryl transferase [Dongiaceae bacterium]|jgi:phosphatidylglycerol:prolipoprotein diacylglycerol transferase|nr:prolipoprotein diacylglyceryl transferase [Dongiaceae bacterium]
MPVFLFPNFDPVALQLGPLSIRWYALAYVVAFLLGWRYCLHWARQAGSDLSARLLDDFFSYAVLGVILGGRIGYILFYNAAYYRVHPFAALAVWQGGMSFHGGLAGMVAAVGLFSWRRAVPFFALSDITAAAGPIGLFMGRLANFVNAELWGRPSDVPWAVIFPDAGPEPRHPSQLYEAGLEGVLLFIFLYALMRRPEIRMRHGIVSGAFLIGYALCRICAEFFREPDRQIGFIGGITTMGQVLSLPMLLVGLGCFWYAWRGVQR